MLLFIQIFSSVCHIFNFFKQFYLSPHSNNVIATYELVTELIKKNFLLWIIKIVSNKIKWKLCQTDENVQKNQVSTLKIFTGICFFVAISPAWPMKLLSDGLSNTKGVVIYFSQLFHLSDKFYRHITH